MRSRTSLSSTLRFRASALSSTPCARSRPTRRAFKSGAIRSARSVEHHCHAALRHCRPCRRPGKERKEAEREAAQCRHYTAQWLGLAFASAGETLLKHCNPRQNLFVQHSHVPARLLVPLSTSARNSVRLLPLCPDYCAPRSFARAGSPRAPSFLEILHALCQRGSGIAHSGPSACEHRARTRRRR